MRTSRRTGPLFAVPAGFVTVTAYSPASAAVTAPKVSVGSVASGMSWPPFVHWYRSTGSPDATTVNTTPSPGLAVRAVGPLTMPGGTAAATRSRRTASLVVEPAGLVTTTS